MGFQMWWEGHGIALLETSTLSSVSTGSSKTQPNPSRVGVIDSLGAFESTLRQNPA
jgi:hypothetical protein